MFRKKSSIRRPHIIRGSVNLDPKTRVISRFVCNSLWWVTEHIRYSRPGDQRSRHLRYLLQTWHVNSLWKVYNLFRYSRSWYQRSRSYGITYENLVTSHKGFLKGILTKFDMVTSSKWSVLILVSLLLFSPAFLAGDYVFACICLSVCLFVCLLPKYIKNQWRYFNIVLQVDSFMGGEELNNF